MSLDSSVTVGDGSGEPAAKRQKTFDYGPQIVLLRGLSEHSVAWKVVAQAPESKVLQWYAASELKTASLKCTVHTKHGVSLKYLDFARKDDSVVKLFAHWINEQITDPVLDLCKPENISWMSFVCKAIRFWGEEDLHSNFHDSLMDCLIKRLQDEVRVGGRPQDLVEELFRAFEGTKGKDLWASSMSGMVPLLATLYLHHLRADLHDRHRMNHEDRRTMDLMHDIRATAMDGLLDAIDRGAPGDLPEDPLELDFEQHCRYHGHEDNSCHDD